MTGLATTPSATTTAPQQREPEGPAARIAARLRVHAAGLPDVDAERVITQIEAGLWPGATEQALRERAIEITSATVASEPTYSKLAARLLAEHIADETAGEGVTSFTSSIAASNANGLLADDLVAFVNANAAALDAVIDDAADDRFEYFGLRTVYDRYLLRHPEHRTVLERPQHFMLRVACGLSGVGRRGRRTLPPALDALVPAVVADAVQLRHPPRRSCPRASCSTPRRTSSTRSTSATARSRGSRSTPGASGSRGRGCVRAGR